MCTDACVRACMLRKKGNKGSGQPDVLAEENYKNGVGVKRKMVDSVTMCLR